jgi:hypothetical protein
MFPDRLLGVDTQAILHRSTTRHEPLHCDAIRLLKASISASSISRSPLTVDAILADGGSLARLHRLKKLIAVGTAALLVMSRVDAALAHGRPADASGSDLEDLTARRVDLGGCCWNNQQSDGKHNDAQHECNPKRSSPWSRHRKRVKCSTDRQS